MTQPIKQNKRREKKLKVALVHDFLLFPGGAERVLHIMAEIYPEAPIYTLLYDKEKMRGMFASRDVRTTFLQKWPRFLRRHYRWLLPFFPSAVETINLRDFDLVISSSGAWVKGLVTRLDTTHIAYIHSPMRYVWDENERYIRRIKPRRMFFVRQLLSYVRLWDYQAAQRPDHFVANSLYTQQRITKYYRKKSHIIMPPVSVPSDLTMMPQKERQDQPFVIIARLQPYKNVALAVSVCKKLRLPLVVIGDGPQYKKLAKHASDTIQFLGWVSDREKWKRLASARALLFPCEDDFGIVCVEALASGTPVIALGRGGAAEIVTDGVHGILFDAPTVEVMADGIRRFLLSEQTFQPDVLTRRARDFHPDVFRRKLTEFIEARI